MRNPNQPGTMEWSIFERYGGRLAKGWNMIEQRLCDLVNSGVSREDAKRDAKIVQWTAHWWTILADYEAEVLAWQSRTTSSDACPSG